MTDVNNTIEYVLSVKDQSSATLAQIRESSATTQQSLDGLTASQQGLATTADVAKGKIEEMGATAGSASQIANEALNQVDMHAMATQVKLTAQLSAIKGLTGALNGTIGAMTTLGILTDDEAKSLGMVTAGFKLITGFAEGLTAIRALLSTINVQSGIMATIQTYTATLSNPAKLALVGGALGAAGAVGGYMLGSYVTNQNNKTTNITVEDTSTNAGKTANQVYDIIGGGAL